MELSYAEVDGCDWPTGRPAAATRSSSCTGIRPPPTSGGTCSATSHRTAAAWLPTWSGWAGRGSCPAPATSATASSSTGGIWPGCWTRWPSPNGSRWSGTTGAGCSRSTGPAPARPRSAASPTWRRWSRRCPGPGRTPPTLTWPREIPLDGTPADVHRIVAANAEFMARTPIPKLFVNGEPGALLTGPRRETCRTWPAQHEITVPGLHFLPEDAPHEIGAALAGWLATLP